MDTSTLKHYTQEMDEGRRTMQLEVDTEKMEQLEKLINSIKENDLLKTIWGRWVHITKPVHYDSSRVDINRMMKFSQEHTNYEVGMTSGEITGIINMDGTATLYNNDGGSQQISLCTCLYQKVKLSP